MAESSADEITPSQPTFRGKLSLGALLALLVLISMVLVIIGDGNVVLGIAPAAVFLFLYLLWKIPLRYSVLLVIYCGLTMNNPYEGYAFGLLHTPLAIPGALLLANLNVTTHISALNFCGMDLLLLYLWFILFYRRARHLEIDGPMMETARPMRMFALVAMLFNFGSWGWGLAHGGNFSHSIWQIHKVLHVPIFFFLCQSAFRGPRDFGLLAGVIVFSGCERALMAVYIRKFIPSPFTEALPYATTHSDSMLFSGALAILVAIFLEKRDRKSLLLLALGGAELAYGMKANTRRLVWVEVAAVVITFYLLSPWSWVKRKLTRTILVGSPLLLLYLAIGWNGSGTGVFAPVKTIKGIIDSKADASTAWRDLENLNLIYTLNLHPWMGPGWGHPYEELIKLPDISAHFEAYRYHPHNGVLGLWGFVGLVGFTGMWSMLVVSVFLAARSYRRSKVPSERAAALASIAGVVVYINQVYGDIGLPAWAGVFLLGPAMAVSGKLAIATGAWPKSKRKRRPGTRPDEVLGPVARPVDHVEPAAS